MTEQIQLYFAIIQRYFGIGVAAFVALQPLLILITSAAHAIEVQGRNRGWVKLQACGYWVAKVTGTFSTVDMRNVQRVGGKVFVILATILEAWTAKDDKKEAVTRAMNDAGRLLILALALGTVTSQAGCAGTLEESRGAIRVTNIAGLTRDDKRCAALSDRNTGFKVSAVTFGAIAPVLLVGSGQVKSDRWQTGLLVASGTSGALAGGAAIGQSYTAASYIEEGCAK